MAEALKRYREKRNFDVTPEPEDPGASSGVELAFVIQKHWASRLHYDLRLELEGVMKSWAVPKGPTYDPSVKRMAVQVEDHPISYNNFEGEIPKGEYGAGKVIIWDEGTWRPVGDPHKGYASGHLKFDLDGVKLKGRWALVRLKGKEKEKQPPWLLIKDRDATAQPESQFSVVDEMPESVVPLRKKRRAPAKKERKTKAKPATAPAKSSLPGKPAALPKTLKPQLATLVTGIPERQDDWLYEIKFDGYRILVRIEDGAVQLFTRNGHDWSSKLPHLVKAFSQMDIDSAWIDGEIVVLTDGVPNFQALQNSFQAKRRDEIVFFAFDLPYAAGRDLRQEPLEARRDLLSQLVNANPHDAIRFSDAFTEDPASLVDSACRMGLEGIMAKRQSSGYISKRTQDWVKLKCAQRQEFVIVGYTQPRGARSGFGALLLAVHDENGALRYAGSVGTGFDNRTLSDIKAKLDAREQENMPNLIGKPRSLKDVQWVKPELVCEVSFAEWTASGHVRHATFRGLRDDKPGRAIKREVPVDLGKGGDGQGAPAALGARGGAKISNPDRVIDPSTGLTKLDLARYYGLVAPLFVSHLKGRPVSFVRAPSGIQGELFFQKHMEAKMPGVTALPASLHPDHAPLLEVASEEAVMSAAQLNVIEFHTWNATKTAIGKPDRMLFDLDPGEGVTWEEIQQAALLVRVLLNGIGLEGWLKTSGGKGLHVDVPIRRQYDWCVFRTNVTGRFGIVTDDFGNVTDHFGNVTERTGRQDWRCA